MYSDDITPATHLNYYPTLDNAGTCRKQWIYCPISSDLVMQLAETPRAVVEDHFIRSKARPSIEQNILRTKRQTQYWRRKCNSIEPEVLIPCKIKEIACETAVCVLAAHAVPSSVLYPVLPAAPLAYLVKPYAAAALYHTPVVYHAPASAALVA
ncbi:hypothetical protein J6590_053299 [Homalodisca vitripennis]|nr:hypothetical protein J6590_072480 [Homalodisca vitripennis]KAG8336076.1 hypothetical protein J6590_053299 [Homalodisca vitripennis]